MQQHPVKGGNGKTNLKIENTYPYKRPKQFAAGHLKFAPAPGSDTYGTATRPRFAATCLGERLCQLR